MKTYGGAECIDPRIRDAGISWSLSHPGRFIRRESVPGAQWIGGWVGLRAGLDTVKRTWPVVNRTPAIQPVAIPTVYKDVTLIVSFLFPSKCTSITEFTACYLSVCTVATTDKAMCKCCGRVFGSDSNSHMNKSQELFLLFKFVIIYCNHTPAEEQVLLLV
jgi:hypothetical protein